MDSPISKEDVSIRVSPHLGASRSVAARLADTQVAFIEKHKHSISEFTPDKEKKLRRKLYLTLVPLVMFINLMLFTDKASLSYGSLLGLLDDTGVTSTQYNNVNTLFYTGYVIAQFPGHYIIQRVPLSYFVSGSIMAWAVIILLSCLVKNYGGLIAVRFLLGVTEACVLPALEITLGMFFLPDEYTFLQPIFWISCVGAGIPSGFIAYGFLFVQGSIPAWKLFMILNGGATFLLAVVCFFYYPSSPATARILTIEERFHTIERIHAATKSSIEQKVFRPYQAYEALRDVSTWLYFFIAFGLMISNNLLFQQSVLFLQIGVTTFGSTLVLAVGSCFSVVCNLITAPILRRYPGYTAYWGAFWTLPGLVGSIGMVSLNWNNTYGLLACLTLACNTFGITYVLALSQASSSASGYTKKLTRSAIFMAGYGVSNIISPQIWVEKYAPRYYGAWAVQIILSFVFAPICFLLVRWVFIRRNKERRAWIAEQAASGNNGTGFVEQTNDDGVLVKVEVELSSLDLTDFENKFFLYPM
ncbi:hypothetical protein V502_08931 [Pseudogymnoascus sp. VKM F-4520 (FW-2644)]|nr:hypothetical protein V502_08931 [Pseudogymnoascus sp. VKM F-4520 (FW-2644)]